MPPVQLNTTAHDHIPEDFTVESLTASGFTEQEIKELASGDDPIVTIPDAQANNAQANQQDDVQAAIGTPPEPQAQAQQPAPQPDPVIPQIPDTAEAEAVIARVNTDLEKLADAYDQGDLTKAEFLAKQNALIQEQAKAQVYVEQAQAAIQNAQETAVQHWNRRLDAYKAVAPELWSEAHLQGWDAHLRMVTGSPVYADLTRDQQIQLAHKLYAATYETKTGQKLASAPATAQPQAQQDKMQVRQDEREPLTTLANVNSDLADAISDSRAAALDKLAQTNPLQAEAQLKQMSADEETRWLMGA